MKKSLQTFPKRFVSKRAMSWYSLIALWSTLLKQEKKRKELRLWNKAKTIFIKQDKKHNDRKILFELLDHWSNDEPVEFKRPFEIIIDDFLVPRGVMVLIVDMVLLLGFVPKLWEPINVEHFWSFTHVWKKKKNQHKSDFRNGWKVQCGFGVAGCGNSGQHLLL